MGRVATFPYEEQRIAARRVRLVHWLFVLGAMLAAVAIALPSVLSQPVLYRADATVRFDPAIYGPLLNEGEPAPALLELEQNLGGVLERTRHPSLRRYGLAYAYPDDQTIVITAVAMLPEQALAIAHDAADGLARRIGAINGRQLLSQLIGQELRDALAGLPPESDDQRLLRQLYLTDAVPGVGVQQGKLALATMRDAERAAVTRALEVLNEQIRHDFKVAESMLRRDAPEPDKQRARDIVAGTANKIRANNELLSHLYRAYNTDATMRESSLPVYVAQDPVAATAIPTYRGPKLALAALVGAVGGVLAVGIDRQVGILNKLQELWSYRQLIRNMVARDLKARYKNSALGYVWSLLNPLLMMLVFWIVFSVLLNNPIPMYPVFLIVALLPWNFAVTSVSGGMRSIIENANLIKKVYFPREILPITVVLSNLVNYIFALPVMFLVMAGVQWFQLGYLNFSWTFLFLPVIVIIQVIFLIGVVLLLSTMAVFLRDTTHIVDILIQLWIFLTPVFFSLEQIISPMFARLLRWVNPMASIIDFYRDILYGQPSNVIPTPGLPALDGVFRTLLTALIVLALGAFVFHRYSGRFGEEI